MFSNVYDVVCVSRFSVTHDYPFGVSNVYDVVCVFGLSITLVLPLRCSLTFIMLSVSPGYQPLLITPSVSKPGDTENIINVREHRRGNPE
jgi:hypothetical protein